MPASVRVVRITSQAVSSLRRPSGSNCSVAARGIGLDDHRRGSHALPAMRGWPPPSACGRPGNRARRRQDHAQTASPACGPSDPTASRRRHSRRPRSPRRHHQLVHQARIHLQHALEEELCVEVRQCTRRRPARAGCRTAPAAHAAGSRPGRSRKSAPSTGSSRPSSSRTPGLSASFRRIHSEIASSTDDIRKGMRQPQAWNCASPSTIRVVSTRPSASSSPTAAVDWIQPVSSPRRRGIGMLRDIDGRAAILAAHRKALDDADQHQQDGRRDADAADAGQEADGGGGRAHQDDGLQEGALATDSDHRCNRRYSAPNGRTIEAGGEGAQREDESRAAAAAGELRRDDRSQRAEQEEVVPLERGARRRGGHDQRRASSPLPPSLTCRACPSETASA